MKTVKFRIWNGMQMEHNIMAGFLGSFYVQGIHENDSASMSQFNTKYPDNCLLMQFTGLADKNGVEIYEGDILSFGTTYKPVVTFENGCFCVSGSPLGLEIDDDNGFVVYNMAGSEVIGNIYENPEL